MYSNPKSPFCLCFLFLKCSASAETKGSKVCVGLSILICCLPRSPLFLLPLRWRLRQILLYTGNFLYVLRCFFWLIYPLICLIYHIGNFLYTVFCVSFFGYFKPHICPIYIYIYIYIQKISCIIYWTKCSLNWPKIHVEKPKLFFSKRRLINNFLAVVGMRLLRINPSS